LSPLSGVLGSLAAGQTKVALVLAARDETNLLQEYKQPALADFLTMNPQLKVVKVADVKGTAINPMPLVLGRAIAGIAPEIAGIFQAFSEDLRGKVSDQEIDALNDLTGGLSSVPLVKVNEDVAEDAETYKEVGRKLEIGA